ncbi:MAG TPA: HAD hydrolase-like protein [Ktedonobacteraceae bacterium]
MKNLIIFDLDGVITSEESYWDCAGLTLHELLYSPRYWHAIANMTYRPAANAREFREQSRTTLPEWLIQSFKARALNSNWDTGYAAICLDLVDLLSHLPERAALLPLQPSDESWTTLLRSQIEAAGLAHTWNVARLHESWREHYPFDQSLFQGAIGLELFERLDAYASQILDLPVEGVFGRRQPFWRFCQQLFQEWLLGDALYEQSYGHPPAQPGKPGCIFFEEPLLPIATIRATLDALKERDYTMGIASGRVFQEAKQPLENGGLLPYFDKAHMGTYDIVTRAEKILRPEGVTAMLGKPHAFHFQAAANWELALQNARQQSSDPLPTPFIAVGDSTSDILSGRAAGALTVAVLTGARTPEARELLMKSQPDFVIEDVTRLPALLDEIGDLTTIQKLQFERREVAEKLLRLWFAHQMELPTESVRLTPKAVSLNSFNGFYTSAGQEYFFKTHVEEHGVLNEYYHADLLEQAGYNVVRPVKLLREKDRQMVIYPVITDPVMFDLMRAQETSQELPAGITIETLLDAEHAECRHLLEIYAHTFQSAQDTSSAPIHQLFWHRLTRRFYEFYADKNIPLPTNAPNAGDSSTDTNAIEGRFKQIMTSRWVINGIEQELTLGELVEQGQRLLNPARPAATVVGHGDAHFGNVFLENAGKSAKGKTMASIVSTSGHHEGKLRDAASPADVPDNSRELASLLPAGRDNGEHRLASTSDNGDHRLASTPDNSMPGPSGSYRYLYFDPAFTGYHSPLLDIVKPLFHNVFAMWMYFPQEIARDLRISVRVEDGRILVDHNYRLTPVRRGILRAKREKLLLPLVAWLKERDELPEDWRDVLRLALMCCPLLTVDLFDATKRPPEIGWLGLSQALQLGNRGLPAWKEDEQ